MNIFKKTSSLLLCMLMALGSFAQDSAQITDGKDFMNSNGKIYVVVAVIVVIVVALFVYLFTLDRKITKLEKDHRQP